MLRKPLSKVGKRGKSLDRISVMRKNGKVREIFVKQKANKIGRK